MRPVSLHSEAHHHPLKLNFTSPYKEKGFTCDVCRQLGLDHWLYRCDACGFDTHLSCAFKPQRHKHHHPQPPPPCHGVMNPQQISQVNTIFRSPTITGHPYLFPGFASAGHLMNGPSLEVPQVAGPDALNNLMVHAGRGFVDGFAQQVGQSVVQTMLGGGAPFSGLNLASSVLGLSSSGFGLGSALLASSIDRYGQATVIIFYCS
ncbi:hypothetical protein QJS10_CPB11g02210 [Acorus calamus]|uniref:DC1 domain-containing protein n=1 Tax=Acorus calamus TaxID=4465 RepID=A0AAV9DW60_ACOCL|nr:hypothetical protein QJS10_CPB11g02210 [Acorus calamus]